MARKPPKSKAPDTLAKTGKTSGVRLTENELGQVRGGTLKHKVGG